MRKGMVFLGCVLLAVAIYAIVVHIWWLIGVAVVACALMTFFEMRHNNVFRYVKGAARAAAKDVIKKNPKAIYEAEELAFRENLSNLNKALATQYATIRSLEKQKETESVNIAQLRKDVVKLQSDNPELAKVKAVAVLSKESFVKKLEVLIKEHTEKHKAITNQKDIFISDMETRLAAMKANAALSETMQAERDALAPLCDKAQNWTIADSESMLDDSINESEASTSILQLPASNYDPDDALKQVLESNNGNE
jgi:hypothetical protein